MSTQTLELPLILPAGPACARCIRELETDLGRIKGVDRASVDPKRATITIAYDPNVVPLSRIENEAKQVGTEIAARIDHQTLDLKDLDCPDCANSIEKAVNQIPGVLWAGANFAAGQVYVEFQRDRVSLSEIVRSVELYGVRAYPVELTTTQPRTAGHERGRTQLWANHRRLIVAGLGGAITALAIVSAASGFARTSVVLYAAAIAIGGWSTARAAVMALRSRAVDMNVLMSLAVIGAAGIGDWFEGAAVVALYNLGALLQAYTIERTRRSIRSLMELTPKTARVRRDGEQDIPVDQVLPGETVLVKPGARIPLDGEVIHGLSFVNEAPITGESVPVEKRPGDMVFAGALNGLGAIEVKTTRLFRETTLARIIQTVEEAHARRAPTQQFIDRFARIYTPMVVALALAVAIIPPIAIAAFAPYTLHPAPQTLWSNWFLRALSLLIIACPCALVISTPVAIVAAIGSASRNGVLIKGGAFLEAASGVRALLYDKTGTLTEGRFRVQEVIPLNGAAADEVLRIAAAIESKSEHPIASAIVEAGVARFGGLPAVEGFESVPGLGAAGRIEGETYLVGNPRLLESHGIDVSAADLMAEQQESRRTTVLVASSKRPIGVITVSDTVREGSGDVIRELDGLGITAQAMLTGDNPEVARSVAARTGLREFRARLLPEEKLAAVREFQQRHGPVGMVGDGINDAPALAAADVGIVMGAAGSDTAIETADIALMKDDLSKLPYLIRLSRRTRAVIGQNVAISLITKAALIAAALTVGIPLWLAVLGDVGVSLLVTLNALRLIGRLA